MFFTHFKQKLRCQKMLAFCTSNFAADNDISMPQSNYFFCQLSNKHQHTTLTKKLASIVLYLNVTLLEIILLPTQITQCKQIIKCPQLISIKFNAKQSLYLVNTHYIIFIYFLITRKKNFVTRIFCLHYVFILHQQSMAITNKNKFTAGLENYPHKHCKNQQALFIDCQVITHIQKSQNDEIFFYQIHIQQSSKKHCYHGL
eukprot:TRINITY_DN38260_c0_g1_i7.p2 TRINITY_DN38260_c0_g1~~TRINITY_DN38260_c0_g1_i7.p2  ORF type:complete len:213 (+),score=-17.38 TRINITY_DN38260_c0_g1_i7:38-640(+)